MRRYFIAIIPGIVLALALAGPAWGCAGLVAPNGSVRLLRTATLAGYHNGIEHYVTSFEFAGGGAKFGSIVPLPGIPKKVTRGGKWTLQRLQEETAPPPPPQPQSTPTTAPTAPAAEELYETEIDGLLITILRGGSRAVGRWAKDEGFALTPDAPEVLRFYAKRSKIFMAARFKPKKATEEEGFEEGDGVPIHLRIPTDNPWVPLRILALGKEPTEDIPADVYLLTDIKPAILPEPAQPGERGMTLERSEQASDRLMADLSSDKGMGWMPEHMWLSYLRIDSPAGDLSYDLAVDVSGAGRPDPEDAYGVQPEQDQQAPQAPVPGWWVVLPLTGVAALRIGRRLRT